MALPANVDLVTVTGTFHFIDATDPDASTVEFRPSGDPWLKDAGAKAILLPKTVVCTINPQGELVGPSTAVGADGVGVKLPAADDPDLAPNGWVYDLTIKITGLPELKYSVSLTTDKPTVDLAELAPVSPVEGGALLVTSVNGKLPNVTGAVVLTAADVGALPVSYTPPPASVLSVSGKTGDVTLTASDVGALPVDYPVVQSVNGKTGSNISIGAAEIGALPANTTAADIGAIPAPGGGGAQVGQVVTATAVSGGVPTAFGLAENLLKAKTGAFVVAAAGGSTPTGSLGVAGNGASLRYTLRLPVTTSRWRFHIRNYNVRDDVTQPGQVDFTGLWVGRYGNVATGWSGAYGPTPTKVLDAWTVADLGAAEYVSPWITDQAGQLAAFTGYQISFGYTAATGTSIARGYSGTYYTVDKADAATVAPAVTGAEVSVFDVWVEYETTTDAPLGIFAGDSIMAGRRATGDAGLGIMSSYPPAYGVRTKSLVNNVALSGSTLSTWQNTAAFRMSRWSGFDWDYAVVGLGTNDIENGSDLATIQTAYGTTLNAIRTAWNPDRIYVCTIAPRSYTGDAAAKHVIRGNLNTWLQGLPFGVQGCFRMDVPVVSPTDANALDPAVATSDLVHLNTVGSQRMAGALPGRI